MRKKELEARLREAEVENSWRRRVYTTTLGESISAREVVDDLLLLLDATGDDIPALRMQAEAKRYVQNHEAMFALAGERKGTHDEV